MSRIEDLAERVERLLLRHEELLRTNLLLRDQHALVTAERDNLRSRLNAARSRIDVLLDRLPQEAGTTDASGAQSASAPDTSSQSPPTPLQGRP